MHTFTFVDIRALLGGDDVLTDAKVLSLFREVNLKHFVPVDTEAKGDAGGKLPLTPHGEIARANGAGDGDDQSQGVCSEYLNPDTKSVVTVDHVKQKSVGERPATEAEGQADPEVEKWRAAVACELHKYVGSAYPGGGGVVYGTGKTGGTSSLVACISSLKISPRNYWTGSWRSEWALDVDTASGKAKLRYKVGVLVHYFEEGNVQLNTSTSGDVSVDIAGGDEGGVEKAAKAMLAEIRRVEKDYLISLEDAYADLSETTFKELRRKLPMTRSHFPWENAESFLASELKGTLTLN